MTAHLAIDLGAESGRAIVGVLEDERLELREVHRFRNRPLELESGLHWNLDALRSSTAEAVRRARALNDDLATIGVDTWGVDYALLDEEKKPLHVPYCYRDARSATAFEETLTRLGETELYAATGNQFMALNTLFQLVAHLEADPETLRRAHRLVFMPDLMHALLGGRAVNEATIASTSQMVDPRTGAWATGVLGAVGLPEQMLGEIVGAGTALGRSPEGVEIVAPASHDTASAVAAVPADPATSWCYLSSGTWSLLGTELEAPCLTEEARRAPFTNEGGGLGGTVRFHKNITGLWLVQECRRALGEERSHAELVALADAAAPLETLIDPADAGFATPGEMPEKIAEFARRTGQPEPEDDGALIRCCLESLALAYRFTLDQLESVLDRAFDVLHVVGGGGRNRLLSRMTADATGLLVKVGPVEATAAGNVLTQAVDDPARIRHIVASSFQPEQYEPDPDGTDAWADAYARFCELVE